MMLISWREWESINEQRSERKGSDICETTNNAEWAERMNQEMVRAETRDLDKVYCKEVLEDSIMEFEF